MERLTINCPEYKQMDIKEMIKMSEEKKERRYQDLGQFIQEKEETALMMSEEEELIVTAKSILLNPAFSLNDRIDLLISVIPEKEIILKSIQQIYELGLIDKNDFFALHAMYCFALL